MSTVNLHRVFSCPPQVLYKAFIDPAAMCKWLPPNGFTGHVQSMDAREGGGYRMSFTNFRTGQSHSFGGSFVEMKPGELLRYTDKFDDPGLPGEMSVTISFRPVMGGQITELTVKQEGIPAQIPVEMCYLGWQESLTLLKQLVEANIP